MKIDYFKSKWDELRNSKEYLQRIDASHPLDFFIGIDENGLKELVLFTEFEPTQMKSSKSIIVEKGKRSDGKWAIQIKLEDDLNQDVFGSLCLDLVTSSYGFLNNYKGVQAVVARFIKWQRLLETGKTGMSVDVIKGLIGEMIFAEKVLMNKYPIDKVINSWVGPDGSDRDYVLDGLWFEVKSISSGKLTVGISSLDQLDVNVVGYLVIVIIDLTTTTDEFGFSFKSIIERFRDILRNNPNELLIFEEKLINLGYYDKKEYDEIFFKTGNISIYKITEDFPRLTHNNVPLEIGSAKYELILSSIKQWKLEDYNLWN